MFKGIEFNICFCGDCGDSLYNMFEGVSLNSLSCIYLTETIENTFIIRKHNFLFFEKSEAK